MAIQVSTFNVKTKKRDNRHIFDDNDSCIAMKVFGAQRELEKLTSNTANELVLTEYV